MDNRDFNGQILVHMEHSLVHMEHLDCFWDVLGKIVLGVGIAIDRMGNDKKGTVEA